MKIVIEKADNTNDFWWYVSNDDGIYVGSAVMLSTLIIRGILSPEPIPSEYTYDGCRPGVCSIGKSEKDGKWYGWSHRAIYGFDIGDVVKEGDCTAMSGYIEEYRHMFPVTELPVGFEAKTEEDAKRMAIAFACSVS